MTPHDFHQMTGLWFDGALTNLEGLSGMQLGVKLLRRRCLMDTIRYFDIKMDFQPLLQVTPENCARMARAFLL